MKKNIDEHYKDWSGFSHLENKTHDSSEVTDFAKYYLTEKDNENKQQN